jgi:hypothetical protein
MITDDVLLSYHLGETSDSETHTVNLWMQSADNKAYYEQLLLIWDAGKMLQPANDIHEAEAWARFSHRINSTMEIHRNSIKPIFYRLDLKIAAGVILLLASLMIGYLSFKSSVPVVSDIPSVENQEPNKTNPIATNTDQVQPAIIEQKEKPAENKILVGIPEKKNSKSGRMFYLPDDCATKEFICNGTACPLEICIIQKSSCNSDRPLSSCSLVEPDQSGKLCYKAKDEQYYKNCALTVEEIRIKRVNTGETIVLNSGSSPLTAQDFIHYMTGEKRGNVVAGVFHDDCDNIYNSNSLIVDNSFGNLNFR